MTPRPAREALRARIFTRSLLPLLEVVMTRRPELAELFRGVSAIVQFRAADVGVYLAFTDGALDVVCGVHGSPDVDCWFRDVATMNAFFAGKPTLPRVRGLFRHPVLVTRIVRLLKSLEILTPEADVRSADDRALRVELVLYLIPNALSQLNHAGHPEMTALAAESPDRVYQWTVGDAGYASYLRMCAGKTKFGRGVYERRKPFVSYTFPTVDGAFRVFTTTGSQMEAVASGDVVPEGSPEYSRKISLMMQKVDELLTAG